MAANNSKFFLSYVNKLVDEYNNNYYHSINKNLINADCYDLTEKIETNLKAPKFKVNDRSKLLSIRIFLVKFTLEIGQDKHLLVILFWKLVFGLKKLKIEMEKNGKKFLWKRIVVE